MLLRLRVFSCRAALCWGGVRIRREPKFWWRFLGSGSVLQNALSAKNFAYLGGAERPGLRRPEAGDVEYLIDRERDEAEHEVEFDFDRAAHADEP